MLGSFIRYIHNAVAGMLLLIVFLGRYRPTWKNIQERKMADTENVKGIDISNIEEKLEDDLIKSMHDRHNTIMNQRTVLTEKLKTLLGISSFAAAAFGALSVTQVLDLWQATVPAVFFVACVILFIQFVDEDMWSFAELPSDEELKDIADGKTTWKKIQIADLNSAYQHNENVRGFLVMIYRGARIYFICGFASSLLVLFMAAPLRSKRSPGSDGIDIEINVDIAPDCDRNMPSTISKCHEEGDVDEEVISPHLDVSDEDISFCDDSQSVMCDTGIPLYLRSSPEKLTGERH